MGPGSISDWQMVLKQLRESVTATFFLVVKGAPPGVVPRGCLISARQRVGVGVYPMGDYLCEVAESPSHQVLEFHSPSVLSGVPPGHGESIHSYSAHVQFIAHPRSHCFILGPDSPHPAFTPDLAWLTSA